VCSTCGIVHCYGGGNGYYRDPTDMFKGFPIEMMYVNPSGDRRRDAKYVLYAFYISS